MMPLSKRRLGRSGGLRSGGTLLLAGRFTVRDDLRAVFAGFDFDLLVAIWLSLINDSIMCCH